jgi:hypothetical protein
MNPTYKSAIESYAAASGTLSARKDDLIQLIEPVLGALGYAVGRFWIEDATLYAKHLAVQVEWHCDGAKDYYRIPLHIFDAEDPVFAAGRYKAMLDEEAAKWDEAIREDKDRAEFKRLSEKFGAAA